MPDTAPAGNGPLFVPRLRRAFSAPPEAGRLPGGRPAALLYSQFHTRGGIPAPGNSSLDRLGEAVKRRGREGKGAVTIVIDALDYLRELNMPSLLLRLTLAMFLGGIIGLDRGRKRRAAGFRTYMLVCLGAALTGIVSQYLYVMVCTDWVEISNLLSKKVDVSRIGAKAIGGIGFLGAGTIIVTGRQEVKGLTTAAGLWASACMGIAIGAGFYECVVLAFVLIFICMRFLPILENFVIENARNMNLYVEFSSLDDVGGIINCIKAQDAQIYEVELNHGRQEHAEKPGAVFAIRLNHKRHHEQVLAAIAGLETVTTIDEI